MLLDTEYTHQKTKILPGMIDDNKIMKEIDWVRRFIRVSVITLSHKLVHLDLVCESDLPGIGKTFDDIEELEVFINADVEGAFKKSIQKVDDTTYLLNCETKKTRALYVLEQVWHKWVGKSIIAFLPVIRKFMMDAISDNLYIEENGKLVKQ